MLLVFGNIDRLYGPLVDFSLSAFIQKAEGGTMYRLLDKRMTRGKENAPPALTPRQKQILHLITQGYTSREIAEQLHISVQTVEVHRFNLMRRLEVRNVAQVIRQALLLRYLPKNYPANTRI